MTEAPKTLRCAIYTRKSSEEGLEQTFNSLDAQREACVAFVESQRHEGWRLVKTQYDDGGYSGGNMERPALKRLLKDIDNRTIDVVVVYKVDRLTRSLSDFAKMVDTFDAHKVSFVSVTQQFNTTTSMGRLTLNVLLSFAQFEREVTGERIRDKIAASKRKGMWMGGCVPLGYNVKGRKLVVNPKEAKLVRRLYKRYLALGCVTKLQAELKAKGVKSKVRKNSVGRTSGGATYSRGALYAILQNHLYRGVVVHRNVSYPGEHQAIIVESLWNAVQRQLKTNGQARRNGIRTNDPSLLAGLLYDDKGNRLTPCHTLKNGKRYRYYVSQAVIHHRADQIGSAERIPAHDIEALITDGLRDLLSTPRDILSALSRSDSTATKKTMLTAAKNRAAKWGELASAEMREFTYRIVSRIIIQPSSVEIVVSKRGLCAALLGLGATKPDRGAHDGELEMHECIRLHVKAVLKRGGKELRLVVPGRETREAIARPNPTLVKAVARGHQWYEQLLAGEAQSVTAIAKANGITDRYVSRIVRCAFLAPDIIEKILEGQHPPDLTLDQLLRLPMDWTEQRRALAP